MKILFLTIGTLNDIREQGIYTDLLRIFRDQGHAVYSVSQREKRTGLPTECVMQDGITMLRVRIGNITKTNLFEKGINTLIIEKQFRKAIEKYFYGIRFDLVLYSTPPITFTKVIRYIKKRDGAKSYLMLKDIFPQNAIDLGMFAEGGWIHRFFRKKEKELYAVSDYIGCMSPGNVQYLLLHNPEIAAEKTEVCPNGITPVPFADKDEKHAVRKKYGLPQDRTLFLYGGNLGKPQGIDFVTKVLKASAEERGSFFVIVGSGTEYPRLKSFLKEEGLSNVMLLEHLPVGEYNRIVHACDAGLLFLDHRFTIPNFPSRILSYMQAGLPTLAATDPNTDLRDLIEGEEIGFWCESTDTEAFINLLKLLSDAETRQRMGQKAKACLEKHYTAQIAYNTVMAHFSTEDCMGNE